MPPMGDQPLFDRTAQVFARYPGPCFTAFVGAALLACVAASANLMSREGPDADQLVIGSWALGVVIAVLLQLWGRRRAQLARVYGMLAGGLMTLAAGGPAAPPRHGRGRRPPAVRGLAAGATPPGPPAPGEGARPAAR